MSDFLSVLKLKLDHDFDINKKSKQRCEAQYVDENTGERKFNKFRSKANHFLMQLEQKNSFRQLLHRKMRAILLFPHLWQVLMRSFLNLLPPGKIYSAKKVTRFTKDQEFLKSNNT